MKSDENPDDKVNQNQCSPDLFDILMCVYNPPGTLLYQVLLYVCVGGIFLDLSANVCISAASAIRTMTAWIGMENKDKFVSAGLPFCLGNTVHNCSEEHLEFYFE